MASHTSASRKTNEAILPTAVDKSFLTSTAIAIEDDRSNYHSGPDLEPVGNTFAYFLDNAGEFMAEGQGYCLSSDWVRFLFWT